ncbi:MAG TPA: methyltransferase domain-containing protein [Candidatus Krumholzibacteria bacterium]|nr:methyltransferase domain-containing protein [Candidatus Krumholzibacteria bacterium]
MRAALDREKLNVIYDHVAARYDLQHSFLTANSDQRGRILLVERAVAAGDTVLDCGAGTGSTGLLAAERVGASGKVVLLDSSEGMLSIAREKASRTHLEDRVEFRTGDMLDLPFEDNRFDVVLSTYSMCPVYDPSKAAREAYRVTRPGGRIGVAHSTDPQRPWVKWMADRVESVVWHLPSVSLGCRSVAVLPTLEDLGCGIIFEKRIGVPLWPFLVFVAQK